MNISPLADAILNGPGVSNETLRQIAQRYETLAHDFNLKAEPRLTTLIDIEIAVALHNLDADRLLTASDPDFLHDVLGIRQHLNRSTGDLPAFSPRHTRST